MIEYYHTDALGSVRAVTKQVNGQWQVVARHDFIPFGEEVAPPPAPADKRLFTGKERDTETGLDYFQARYLRVAVGRFTTVDPIMAIERNLLDPQQWNRYTYVTNNPLRYVDPDGRYGIDVHYYLTYTLAAAAGYSSDAACNIAWADANIDVKFNPWTCSTEQRRQWHFPDDARVAELVDTFTHHQEEVAFGQALHVFQDSYSHAEYGPRAGHFWTDEPDNTSLPSKKALGIGMAEDTYYVLLGNGGQTERVVNWKTISPFIERFLSAKSESAKRGIFEELLQCILGEQQR